ncbi:hypothetical protein CPB84DRAFT_1225757 [Gymnopilus junonius]|uniref:Uncharacterized protein n=1 Tax=Gymnopilus junonius TaxID=109634 RepID=A0A9P5NW15_GYMJU|nr:hypothetical protein CPB84DRAFT_1225757 [Gymnopilus junonius]
MRRMGGGATRADVHGGRPPPWRSTSTSGLYRQRTSYESIRPTPGAKDARAPTPSAAAPTTTATAPTACATPATLFLYSTRPFPFLACQIPTNTPRSHISGTSDAAPVPTALAIAVTSPPVALAYHEYNHNHSSPTPTSPHSPFSFHQHQHQHQHQQPLHHPPQQVHIPPQPESSRDRRVSASRSTPSIPSTSRPSIKVSTSTPGILASSSASSPASMASPTARRRVLRGKRSQQLSIHLRFKFKTTDAAAAIFLFLVTYNFYPRPIPSSSPGASTSATKASPPVAVPKKGQPHPIRAEAPREYPEGVRGVM